MMRRAKHFGFTLFELLLVMVLACIVLGMVAPSVANWSRGGRLRDATDQFLATARYARTQAVANITTYRITIDSSAGTYQLTMQSAGDFVALGTARGKEIHLPEGVQIQLLEAQQTQQQTNTTSGSSIDFYPTGRTQPAKVRLSSDRGETVDIECPSPAEGLIVVSTSGASR